MTVSRLNKSDNAALARALLRKSYPAYCHFVHRGRWIDSKFHKFLANKVQKFVETETGNPYDILVIETPPQHGKSMTVTETLPSWYIGKNPDKRCIVACYNDDFAGKFGRRNKSKIEEFGGEIFGVKLSKSSDRNIEIQGHDGGIITRGIMSGITGNAGDLIIIDDPVKNRQEADSQTYRNRVWEEWENSIITRTQAGTKIIVIQTRWHEDDLAGRIISREKDVEVLKLPVEAEENDPLGRTPGEALCPEIGKGNKWLKAFKARYKEGKRAWYALYQQSPVVETGNIIRREWWKYYDELPPVMPLVSISVDATFKGEDDNDYVAIEVWGRCNADFYLIDLLRRHMDFPETVRAIKMMARKYPQKHSILIEDKANGPAIISTLRHEIPGIVAIDPGRSSKISRVNAVTGVIEAGNVYLPRYADFTQDFVDECAAFPNGVHDDMVDAFSQFLNKFKYFVANYKEDKRTTEQKELDELKTRTLRRARKGINGQRRSYF